MTVTQFVQKYGQPYGGVLPRSAFTEKIIGEPIELDGSVTPKVAGIAVDNLARYLLTGDGEEAFKFAIRGAALYPRYTDEKKLIGRLDGETVRSAWIACALAMYEIAYRIGPAYNRSKEKFRPTKEDAEKLLKMARLVADTAGDAAATGAEFKGAYTTVVTKGDCDIISHDTLWDVKATKTAPNSAATLQLLVYYLMGLRTGREEFHAVTKLGIVNPRLGKTWTIGVSDIPEDVIRDVSTGIGY